MAQHDYINRKRPQRGKNRKAPAKKPLPLVLIALAILLLASFAYGLWYIKTNADPEAVEQVKQKPSASKPEIKKPQTPEFINEIKQAEIEVEVKEIEQKGPYQMQCGSFRTYAQAETLKAKIAFVGLVSEIRRTEGSNGVWFRVRLGPYPTKRGAESDKNKLKRQAKIMGCGIWLWN
ncbi:SPOR domain-containing protein [Pseudoalteromonas ruthenica]|uniref:SPOR domain-containing protein n=1 Tax=Pseudoalteromonas ruthenica TaxID=151081 RepID=UPI0011096FF8|nr:SPOR domain-containing protein [Pseudoalteromonas ruthenica]TLX51417.1 SPOR domain-containing protein [Pseudoalteromonas ruthenica]